MTIAVYTSGAVPAMDRSLFLLAALTRSLAHQVRTPLSVIHNELSFMRTLLPEGECDRALGRCKEIASILKEVNNIGPQEISMQGVSRDVVIAMICDELKVEPPLAPSQGDSTCIVDMEKLRTAFRFLRMALENHEQVGEKDGHQEPLTLLPQGVIQIIRRGGPTIAKESCSYRSATEFFSGAYLSDCVEAPLADAIFIAHSIALKISPHPDGSLSIQFCIKEGA